VRLVQRLIGALLRPRVRRRARGKTLDQLADQLAASSDVLLPRILAARDTPANREAINHWVGIERWSLARVRRWRDPPTELEPYHAYRLPEGASLEDLQEAFARARQESIALAREMARTGADPAAVVPHNDLGPLTVTEWFEYIDDHTRREVIRLRT
jgi:hypothetical protein